MPVTSTARNQNQMKKNKKKKEKKEIIYIDDGRTVVDMDVEGFPWHGSKKRKKERDRITFREKLAIVFGAYRAYLPYLIIGFIALGLMYLLIRLWLGA